jgi:hypothetical protein
MTRSVRQAVDEALVWLSGVQLASGDFASWGTRNVESAAQVIIALCALGIDPQRDLRFVKNGVSLLDGLLRYRRPDGGFIHAAAYDPENPTSRPDQSNSMAGEQALCCLVAVWRQMNGLNPLYDFRPDPAGAQPSAVMDGKSGASGASGGQAVFSDSDKAAVDALPEKPSTGQYVEVVRLLAKLERCPDFTGKERYVSRLTVAKEKILDVQAEIDDINRKIRERLYPFVKISQTDKKLVDSLAVLYQGLISA